MTYEAFRIVGRYKTSELEEMFGEGEATEELLGSIDEFLSKMNKSLLSQPPNLALRNERSHYIVEWVEVEE